MEIVRKCLRCNKKLRDFKTTTDWNKRKYHKTCWKENNIEDTLNYFIKQRLC